MKISNKKIIVSTLALAMGAALAGSISGSVAWYQYSTRAAAQITGTSIGTEGRLQVKLGADGTYSQKITKSGDSFKPTSISGTTVGAYTYYDHPVYQTASLPAIDSAAEQPYKEYELYFKYEESTSNPQSFAAQAKSIYLTYFAIENAGTGADVSDAVRVELIGSTNKFLLSKSETAQTTATTGQLDLNANGANDTNLWDCSDSDGAPITYVNGTGSYTTSAHTDALVAVTDANVYNLESGNTTKVLATSASSSADGTALKVRVWLEGWQELRTAVKPANGTVLDGNGYYATRDAESAATGTADGNTTYYKASSVWDAGYIDQTFNINMQFACSANK